jgi:hypothetical protein
MQKPYRTGDIALDPEQHSLPSSGIRVFSVAYRQPCIGARYLSEMGPLGLHALPGKVSLQKMQEIPEDEYKL